MGLFDPSIEGFLWVLALSVTVILIDVFFQLEVLSAIALLAVSTYFAALCDVAVKWQLLITLACWLVSSLFFFLVARKFMIPLVNLIIPKGEGESILKAGGSLAVYRLIDNEPFVYWNGDLWPVSNEDTAHFKDHDKVRIESAANGIFTIKKGEE
jgi:membrane protein implicated in regulation of membrane protease activity